MRIIVVNPAGGWALGGPRLNAALRVLRSLPGPQLVVMTDPEDMVAPVRTALEANPSVTQVVAVGGDGTVAACAAALDGRDVPLAIVPTGTTNVLAFELGVPANPVRAARLLAGQTRTVRVRTWSANGRAMTLQLGVGFDGLLMWRTTRRAKRVLGFLSVVANAARYGLTFDYPEIRVAGVLESGAHRHAVATSVLVANASRWAGARVLVPSADPSDDVLDVLLLRYRNFPQLAAFWLGILLPGTPHLRLGFVEHVRMQRIRIEGVGRPVEAHLDGEPALSTPIDIEPRGYVRFVRPAA